MVKQIRVTKLKGTDILVLGRLHRWGDGARCQCRQHNHSIINENVQQNSSIPFSFIPFFIYHNNALCFLIFFWNLRHQRYFCRFGISRSRANLQSKHTYTGVRSISHRSVIKGNGYRTSVQHSKFSYLPWLQASVSCGNMWPNG